MKKISLGKVSIDWLGEWDKQYPYKRLHGISHAGSSYVALKDNVGVEPSSSTSDTWKLIAQKGDKGDAFTYDDFTPEQIEELQRPASEAAVVALAAAKGADASAVLADKAREAVLQTETTVQNNEAVRQQNETDRERGYITFTQNATELMGQMEASKTEADQAAAAANSAAETTLKTNEDIIKAETSRVEAETSRAAEEKKRVSAETSRQEAENSRNVAENERKLAETARSENESSRLSSEESRVGEENKRKENELARQEAENLRVSSENKRLSAEESRTANENARKAEETKRSEAEEARITEENKRVAAETSRQDAESSRQGKEAERQSAETTRTENENTRLENERLRSEAEQSRNSTFQTLKEQSETATSSANEAAENANKAAQTATEASAGLVEFDGRLSAVEEITAELQLAKSDYGVAEWNPEELAPESVAFYGQKDFLTKWNFYLLDTTDNQNETTTPVGKLRRNNLLRFENGDFAPVIGITEAQRAECDVELYLDADHTQKYCDAGTFDAAAFYNEHGMAKLYNVEGSEVRVLRPWETTETKYTIGIGREDTVYLLDNVVGTSGRKWKGVFTKPIFWDGIDLSKYPLVPTAFGPGPSCTVEKKTRNFLFLYKGETNCQSSKGQNNLCTMFYDQEKTYPRVNDMQQINNMTYARANNADVNAPYPFAEGGYHTLNTYITCLEVFYGTKYLHNALMFGSGISSNDSCSNEENWLQNGGVRYKKHDETAWKYAKWNEQKDIYYDNSGKRTTFTVLLNMEHPKEACMESQMAVSFAVETGVSENTEFDFYGYKYRYVSVPGTDGTASMNVRLYKIMSQTFNAFDAEGNDVEWDVEVILRMSLYGGVNLSGDIFMYCGGGYEQVGTCQFTTSGSKGNPIDLYLEPDQRKWHTEKTSSRDDLGTFDFERSYIKTGSCTNIGDGYSVLRSSYSGWKQKAGGSISTGECYYTWDNNHWSTKLNQRTRIAARFRGYASTSFCSPRALLAHSVVTSATRSNGGSAQALLGSAAPLQAE
ncbi:hypothetical protein [Bacteroides sp. ET336]|uniref:hypothetical protein n=1 Tax=Bacteroides sp. ET336 TaxID=2972459 RepID=UPI0021AC926D|nr:hypothetical protein [Bacteroides sp. ET336]MCR8892457.1 hypothetical protein [Bacteroides sp. ET336]MDN0056953.1 hypothetical protein [Bacteroides caecigallinarum]